MYFGASIEKDSLIDRYAKTIKESETSIDLLKILKNTTPCKVEINMWEYTSTNYYNDDSLNEELIGLVKMNGNKVIDNKILIENLGADDNIFKKPLSDVVLHTLKYDDEQKIRYGIILNNNEEVYVHIEEKTILVINKDYIIEYNKNNKLIIKHRVKKYDKYLTTLIVIEVNKV